MSYQTDYALATGDDILFQRVMMAFASACNDIQNEPSNTANHAARSAYALAALNNLPGYTKVIVPLVVTDGSVNDATTDAAIKTRISAVFNSFCVQG